MDAKVLKEAERRGHEQVTFFHYPKVGLKAIVAIHNTVLGPALGGCRMRLYEDEGNAIDDVMRLSEGMTYKSSLAGLDLGGGKSCIIADPFMTEGRRELFAQFAKCLNDLNGRYVTAEDMGTSVEDVTAMREITNFVVGHSLEKGGSGDPSPWTAKGVFHAIEAACERKFGSANLAERCVAVQGVGHVGIHLVRMLKEAGARVVVADTNEGTLKSIKSELEVEVVGIDQIYDAACDVYAPCAIGQTVNPETVSRLKCGIIAGAANNQLNDDKTYDLITRKGILYCPDFVINSGGVISVGAEYKKGGWDKEWVTSKVEGISKTIHRVLDKAEQSGTFPEVAAIALAKERISAAEKKC